MKANRVTLIGYVGNELTNRKTAAGIKVSNIRLATHYCQKNKEGEKKIITVWHNVAAWNRLAEYAERSFVKGSKIMVEGFIEYRTYADKAGHTRYITQIRAFDLLNLDR